jgi:hypothetical protein
MRFFIIYFTAIRRLLLFVVCFSHFIAKAQTGDSTRDAINHILESLDKCQIPIACAPKVVTARLFFTKVYFFIESIKINAYLNIANSY